MSHPAAKPPGMHDCAPPLAALAHWLTSWPTVTGKYGHLLLEQKAEIDDGLIAALRPYFESAHLDAREHIHQQIGISLHPDGGVGGGAVCYPNCLPPIAHRGLFGEVMAGMVTEAYQNDFVGKHGWKVPIFLFRQHVDAEHYLWNLKNDPTRKREIFGRQGSDFVGVALDANGKVMRVIAGEAKWRKSLTASVVDAVMLGEKKNGVHNGKGVWFEVNRDTPIPHGLRQLGRLLELRDPNGHAAAILSIDQAVLRQATPDRTNLILLVGNSVAGRDDSEALLQWEQMPKEYKAKYDLQVVEVILEDGEKLIDGLYASLWEA